jgi:hypothetical protein
MNAPVQFPGPAFSFSDLRTQAALGILAALL